MANNNCYKVNFNKYLIIMAILSPIISYNTTGLGGINKDLLRDMLEQTNASFCLLQETWLLKRDICVLNNLHNEYIGHGISAVPDTKILIGRPYGGVGILWKKCLAQYVTPLDIDSDRVMVTLGTSRLLILNVYMPGDTRHRDNVSSDYETCLDIMEKCMHEHTYDYLIIGGDFNTDLRRNNAHAHVFEGFIERNALICGWDLVCAGTNNPSDIVTFTTPNGHTSCIDHFIFTCNMQCYINNVYPIKHASYTKDSGHYPIIVELPGMSELIDCLISDDNVNPAHTNKIAWHKVTDYVEYSCLVSDILSECDELNLFAGLQCSDHKCRDPGHLIEIDFICKTMTDICISAADLTLPKCGTIRTNPNWTEHIKPLRAASILWGNIWNDNGRPTSGIIYEIYRKCRHEYHYAIRENISNAKTIRRTKMADAIAANDSRELWTEVKKVKGGATQRAPHIDGQRSHSDINDIFMNKYKSLYNSVPSDMNCILTCVNDNIHEDSDTDYVVDISVVEKALDKIKSDKSDGDKGLFSNLVINSPDCWKLLLSRLFSSMICHGHTPDELLVSTISSLPKSNRGDICNSDNYRGIALTSCINKVLDWVVLIKYSDNLQTSNLQYAYKPGHSTSMCSLALKEVVNYYNSRGGEVYCCLIDATKAFDRVRFDKLFQLLLDRNIPKCIIRLLIDMYVRQRVRTSWGCTLSSSFSVINGVRQGGVLSPVLFAVYIDVLLNRLESAGFGCYVGHEYMGALGSADDITLLTPTLHSLQKSIEICEKYGVEYDVVYNAKKTICMYFNGKRIYRHDPPRVYLNGHPLEWSIEAKHLGNIISWNLSEEAEIKYKTNDFIGRCNSLVANFKCIDRSTASNIFRSQCCHFYGCQSWALKSKYVDKFDVIWRKSVRKLWNLPNIARSVLLPELVDMRPVSEQAASRFANMYNKIMKGVNNKLLLLCNISVHSHHKGIIGHNVDLIVSSSGCTYDHLTYTQNSQLSASDMTRVEAVKELTANLERGRCIEDFSTEEAKLLINCIVSYYAMC